MLLSVLDLTWVGIQGYGEEIVSFTIGEWGRYTVYRLLIQVGRVDNSRVEFDNYMERILVVDD